MNKVKGIQYDYSIDDYPVAKLLCYTYTVVHGIHAPNGIDLMRKFVDVFHKVFDHLGQVLDRADDPIYPGADGRLYGAA